MSTEIIIGTISVILAVLFYSLTERKTIGVKKEKINSVYNNIVKIIFKSVIHNDYIPSIIEIERMITTKCAENNIQVKHLPEPVEFINAVYTKIMDNEILESRKKKSLIKKINGYLEKKSEALEEESGIQGVPKEERFRLVLMLLSSLLAAIVSFFTMFYTNIIFSRNQIYLLIGVFIAAVAASMVVALLKRFKEKPTVSSPLRKRYREYTDFETKIARYLRPLNYKRKPRVVTDKGRAYFDFEFRKGSKTYYVEVKTFAGYISRFTIRRMNDQAKLIKFQDENNLTILVVNDKSYIRTYITELSKYWDYILDKSEFREFRNKLVHSREN